MSGSRVVVKVDCLIQASNLHLQQICDTCVMLLGNMKRRNRRLEKRPPLASFDHSLSSSYPEFMPGVSATVQ